MASRAERRPESRASRSAPLRHSTPGAYAIAAGLPMLLTAAVFLRSVRNGFVYDDNEMIVLNRHIGDWSFFWKAFANDSWWFRDPLRLPQSAYYRPLQDVWLGLNYHLFGFTPAGWHAAMIAIQLAAVWLVFAIARELLRDSIGAAIAAALFGVMPIHAQAIVWPAAIPLPMSACFEMAALLCFISRAAAPRRNRALAIGFFACALLSHESAVLFPFLLAAYMYLLEPRAQGKTEQARLGRFGDLKRSVMAALPFAVETIAYLAIRFSVLGFVSRANRTNSMTLSEKILTIPGVLAHYLILIVMPWRAGPAHPVLPARSLLAPEFYLPMLGLVATMFAIAVLIGHSPHRRLHLFCALWILIPIIPVLNLGALSALALVEDRYLYLPSAGWCILLGDLAIEFAAAGKSNTRYAIAAASALAVAYAASLWRVEHYWHDEIALFGGCVEMYPASTICHGRLAMALEGAGDWRGAERELLASERLKPDDGATLYNLALLHDRFGAHRAAEAELSHAIDLLIDSPVQPYLELARVADEAGDLSVRERALAHAAAMPEGPAPAMALRAQLMLAHRDYASAAETLKKLSALAPRDVRVWVLLGDAEVALGKPDDALASYERALELNPGDSNLHLLRAWALDRLGRNDDALAECGRALALNPQNQAARDLARRIAKPASL